MKFKDGDIVIGNAKADKSYSTTCTGTIWTVIPSKVNYSIDFIRIKCNILNQIDKLSRIIQFGIEFEVRADCFDLYKPKEKKDYYPGWL